MIKDRPRRLDLIYPDPPVFFVTFCTRDRKQIPSLEKATRAFEHYANRAADEFNIAVGRYVIMPDHVHFFVRGGPDFLLSSWVGGLKRARSVALSAKGGLWHPGFFDHSLRSDESYSEKWDYMRDNPVRARLTEDADKWPYQGEIVIIDGA
jgi:REP-associated tyrosine transposase